MFAKPSTLRALSALLIGGILLGNAALPVSVRADSVIIPTYHWHTFYGGGEFNDTAENLAIDTEGNVYLIGESNSTWNGPSGTPPLNPHSGGLDIVVIKLSSNGAYQWHTFFGGASADYGDDIALDIAGNVYVIGASYGSWNGTEGSLPIYPHIGSGDITLLKLSGDGGYQWHSFFGSPAYDEGRGIKAADSGNIVITGSSSASWDGPSATAPLNPHAGSGDIVVMEVSSTGQYQWHTFFGSADSDSGEDVTLDDSGNILIAANSNNSWNGPGETSPLDPYSSYPGWQDLAIVKLSGNGNYLWHSFYGGGNEERHPAIETDSSDNIYIAGHGYGSWNGPAGEPPLHEASTEIRIYTMKLSSMGAYQWHTFYSEIAFGIALDDIGNIYVVGSSYRVWNGPGGALPLHPHSGMNDALIVKLNNDGGYQWHTFYGGKNHDWGYGIGSNAEDNIYIVGSGSPWSDYVPLNPYSGGRRDIFAAQLVPTVRATFISQGQYDGWILESAEISSKGGTINVNGQAFALGDDTADKQYRSILHFNTSSMPDTAIVKKVTLKIKKKSVVGADPFTTHQYIKVDIRSGGFSDNVALQLTDFQAFASKSWIGTIKNNPVGDWYSAVLKTTAFPYINLTGATQFRLYFALDDDDDNIADLIKFSSGDDTAANRPQLIVEYYVP